MSTRRALPVLVCCAIIASAAYLVVAADTNAVAITPEPVVEQTENTNVETDTISATAYAVFDVETGNIISSKNADVKRPIASVTKLVSAAAALENVPLDTVTEITWTDVETEGRSGKLSAGDTYSNRELLWPLLLESSNDAATALQRANPELITQMNEFAHSRDLKSFNFADASGLSAGNTANVHDLAVLTAELYRTEPHLFDMTQLPKYVGQQTGWINNNPFIHDEAYRGGKHGFTYEAGRTGVFIFDEGDKTLGYVVLGSDDLVADVTELRH